MAWLVLRDGDYVTCTDDGGHVRWEGCLRRTLQEFGASLSLLDKYRAEQHAMQTEIETLKRRVVELETQR